MKIAVFVKHVPGQAITPRIAACGDRIDEHGLAFEANEADLYAIEEALQQRTTLGGDVTAVTIGPARAREALHVAYAKGADHAIHVVDEKFRGCDPLLNVQAAALVARRIACDMIFAGIQAEDDMLGQFGVALGETLDLPVVTAVTGIRVDAQRRTAEVVRELGEGFRHELEVDLPCVLTIQFGIRPLRYMPVMSVVRARSRPIEALAIEALGLTPDAPGARGMRVLELRQPPASGRCELLGGSPREMAGKLVRTLEETGII